MTTTKRSKCHHCAQPITEQIITKAKDAQQYINEYSTDDDDVAWIGRDGNAICYTNDVAHCTSKEWYAAQ